ncbi:MAG: lipopolysaccharide export system protein LptA [Paracoccaceae bacterium]|jgi:lipopolysaccharide export system protein LptA
MFRVIFAILVLLAGTGFSAAQGAQVAFGALQHDSTLPVEITAQQLEINQDDGGAVFMGDVIVAQGEMRLSAQKVEVRYASGENTSGDIDQLLATGGVIFVTGPEVAEAREAVYTLGDSTLRMLGGVLLTQGSNTLAGEQLDINLDAGTGVMTGRVRVIFKSGDDK